MYYDYTVTLTDEIKYIWSQPRSVGSLWFFANRYINFLGYIPLLILHPTETEEQVRIQLLCDNIPNH